MKKRLIIWAAAVAAGLGLMLAILPATSVEAAEKPDAPSITSVRYWSEGHVSISWSAVDNARYYRIYRKTSDTEYVLIDKVKSKITTYLDASSVEGETYYYAIQTSAKINGKYKRSDLSEAYVTEQVSLATMKSVKYSKAGETIVRWDEYPGAEGYVIYKSKNPNKLGKRVKTIKDGTTTALADIVDEKTGVSVYYSVRPYYTTGAGIVVSVQPSEKKSIKSMYRIMGKSRVTKKQLVNYYHYREANDKTILYPSEMYASKGAPTIEDFVDILYEECEAEGVRAEVAFAQVILETGNIMFPECDVSPEQCNFAGLGATGGGEPGITFPDVRTGLRAQVQHLKAYASKDSLNGILCDERFKYVTRGCSPFVEWLGAQENPNGGGWAKSADYGNHLVDNYIAKFFTM